MVSELFPNKSHKVVVYMEEFMKKEKINYLDLTPEIKESLEWHIEENGGIIILCQHKSITDKIASFIFKMPKTTQVHLDEFGSFVWLNIDGKSTVYDIAQKIKEKFGEKSEPLYERICKYFSMLENNGFVEIKKL